MVFTNVKSVLFPHLFPRFGFATPCLCFASHPLGPSSGSTPPSQTITRKNLRNRSVSGVYGQTFQPPLPLGLAWAGRAPAHHPAAGEGHRAPHRQASATKGQQRRTAPDQGHGQEDGQGSQQGTGRHGQHGGVSTRSRVGNKTPKRGNKTGSFRLFCFRYRYFVRGQRGQRGHRINRGLWLSPQL